MAKKKKTKPAEYGIEQFAEQYPIINDILTDLADAAERLKQHVDNNSEIIEEFETNLLQQLEDTIEYTAQDIDEFIKEMNKIYF